MVHFLRCKTKNREKRSRNVPVMCQIYVMYIVFFKAQMVTSRHQEYDLDTYNYLKIHILGPDNGHFTLKMSLSNPSFMNIPLRNESDKT